MERDTRREMARERRADRHADADAHGETRPWKQRGREHVPETRSTPETAPAHLQATGAGARPLHPLRVALILPRGPASTGRGRGELCLQNPWEVTRAMLENGFFSLTRSFAS